MNQDLSSFAARLRGRISLPAADGAAAANPSNPIPSELPHVGACQGEFQNLALELFALQFQHNPAYRKICKGRGVTPGGVEHWTQIPFVPTSAFKELDLSCLPPEDRVLAFHSSGTTEQKPSRHFHGAESLAVYDAALWAWFAQNVLGDAGAKLKGAQLVCLAPSPEWAPNSSLVHMFETVRQRLGAPEAAFVGELAADGSWAVDFGRAVMAMNQSKGGGGPKLILGTAFSFVHLLDYLTDNNLRLELPAGSRVMETGGYKNRSRILPKFELHALITEWLGVPRERIICEYGMSELSSQAYDTVSHPPSSTLHPRFFQFPPWARAQIISPETGREVADGETGLIRIFDLANVFSVAAIQTEDLGLRRGDGFELVGRAQRAEPRGCSLMTA